MSLFLATCLMCSAHQPKAQEKQRLVEQLSGLNAAHAEEVQRLRAEMQQLREDAARDAQVQQLQKRLAELEKNSVKSCLGQEVEELRQVCLSGDALALLGLQGSLRVVPGGYLAARTSPRQGSGCTCPSAFPQRLAEVEAVKLQLGEERDALIQRMLEQSQDLEGKRGLLIPSSHSLGYGLVL